MKLSTGFNTNVAGNPLGYHYDADANTNYRTMTDEADDAGAIFAELHSNYGYTGDWHTHQVISTGPDSAGAMDRTTQALRTGAPT